jgi:hypothetical protein
MSFKGSGAARVTPREAAPRRDGSAYKLHRGSLDRNRSSMTNTSAKNDLLAVQQLLMMRGEKQDRWYHRRISPHSSFMSRWDLVCCVGLAYTALAAPYDIAFRNDTPTIDTLFAINSIVDFVFLIDVMLNFILKFRDGEDETGQWVTDYRRIAKRYIKGWFAVDVVSVIPFDLISMAMVNSVDSSSELGLFKVFQLLRLVKLARIARLRRILGRFEDQVSLSFAAQSIVKFLCSVTVVCHWLACAWRLTVALEDHVSWYILEGYSTQPVFDVYVTCLYWAASTITTIGKCSPFGDSVVSTNLFLH